MSQALVGQHVRLLEGQPEWCRTGDGLFPPCPRGPQKPAREKGQSPEQDQTLYCRSTSSLLGNGSKQNAKDEGIRLGLS